MFVFIVLSCVSNISAMQFSLTTLHFDVGIFNNGQCLNVCFVFSLVYYISVQRNLVLAHFDAAIFHRQCGIPREGGHDSPDAGARKTYNVMNVSKSQETG